jgi:hypothetical protein
LGAPDGNSQPDESILIETDSDHDEFMQALLARRDNGPERKLQKLIEFDENHAATILKQWIRQGANGSNRYRLVTTSITSGAPQLRKRRLRGARARPFVPEAYRARRIASPP